MNYKRQLRKIRQNIFNYPPELEEKALRVLRRLKAKAITQRQNARLEEVMKNPPPVWRSSLGPSRSYLDI